jgi:hypothetical protein
MHFYQWSLHPVVCRIYNVLFKLFVFAKILMLRDRYRLTAALKDETDIVTSITATSIGRAVISL